LRDPVANGWEKKRKNEVMRQSEEGEKDDDDWTVYRTEREEDRHI
jgi:hypothetical protein